MAVAEARMAQRDAEAEREAAAAASASSNATTSAQGQYATWYARTGTARRMAHFEERVLPELGIDWDAFKATLEGAIGEATSGAFAMPQVARAAWDALRGALPAEAREYVATRLATFGK
eukprot:4950656-Prymnesium_polylepis.1